MVNTSIHIISKVPNLYRLAVNCCQLLSFDRPIQSNPIQSNTTTSTSTQIKINSSQIQNQEMKKYFSCRRQFSVVKWTHENNPEKSKQNIHLPKVLREILFQLLETLRQAGLAQGLPGKVRWLLGNRDSFPRRLPN